MCNITVAKESSVSANISHQRRNTKTMTARTWRLIQVRGVKWSVTHFLHVSDCVSWHTAGTRSPLIEVKLKSVQSDTSGISILCNAVVYADSFLCIEYCSFLQLASVFLRSDDNLFLDDEDFHSFLFQKTSSFFFKANKHLFNRQKQEVIDLNYLLHYFILFQKNTFLKAVNKI